MMIDWKDVEEYIIVPNVPILVKIYSILDNSIYFLAEAIYNNDDFFIVNILGEENEFTREFIKEDNFYTSYMLNDWYITHYAYINEPTKGE